MTDPVCATCGYRIYWVGKGKPHVARNINVLYNIGFQHTAKQRGVFDCKGGSCMERKEYERECNSPEMLNQIRFINDGYYGRD